MTFTLEQMLSGWRAEASTAGAAPLLGGCLVEDVLFPVQGQGSLQGADFAAPRLLLVPANALRRGGGDGWMGPVSTMRLSGANRHRRGTGRSLTLFYRLRNDAPALERACLLATLVGLRNANGAFNNPTEGALRALLDALALTCPQDVWPRRSSAPMPTALPKALRTASPCEFSAALLGAVLRAWHDTAFAKLAPVRATPKPHEAGLTSAAEFYRVADRYVQGLPSAPGEIPWKILSRSDLERAVWSLPRTKLSKVYGVSDVAISKRCRVWNIDFPPRGYWQRIEVGADPRPLLEKSSICAPQFVLEELGGIFDLKFCA